MTLTPDLKKQLFRFIVVGCSAVAADFVSYTLLLNFFDYAPAKSISFILGTVVAYVCNKYWTFEKPEHKNSEVLNFIVLYTTTLGVNVGINNASLLLFPELVIFAFLCATGSSTILNFIGQKWWVFRHR
ncbi:GtrA family protein [Patescibacteria group bacterium]|nr:GtrA family protein [Patescibacteria group bacterium]